MDSDKVKSLEWVDIREREWGGGMAKPWKAATLICTIVTVIAAIGIIMGLVTGNVFWPVVLMFPAVAYQAYRTEGESTRWASWVLALLLVTTFALMIFGVEYDLRQLLGEEEAYVAGQVVPLGDVKTVMPAVMAICAVILLFRTRGRYTRWLAAVIFVTSLFIVYAMDPKTIGTLLRIAIQRVIW